MTMTPVSSATPKVLFLLEELPPDPEVVGSKAANLVEAASRGLKIPRTAVIPTSVYNELVPWDGLTVQDTRARIASLDLGILARSLRAELESSFGDIRFAVRSSSNMEDGAERSFAGQYESFLDVPLDGIADAVRACWLSLWGEEAISYRGDTDARPSMAVIIQPFLQGRLGGVAFSADPVTGNPFQIVIESSGDASAVTDGNASTAVTRLDLHEVILRKAPEPFQSIAEACLTFERPVDVEWTWDPENGLSILQVRPITGMRRFAAKGSILDRYCLPIPEPFSRLGASLEFEKNAIYQRMVRRLSTPGFRSQMLVVYGRLYLFEEEPGVSSKGRVAVGLLLSMGHALLYLSRRRAFHQPIERAGSARESLLAAIRGYLAFYRASSYAGYLYNNATGLLVRYLNLLTSGRYNRPLLYSLLACPRSVTVRRDKSLNQLSTRLRRTDDPNWLAQQTPEFKAAYEAYCREFAYVFADRNPRDPHFRIDHGLAYSLLASRQHSEATGSAAWEREVFTTIRQRRFGSVRLAVFRLLKLAYCNSVGLVKEDRNHVFYLASARIREFIELERASLCSELSLGDVEDLYFMTPREIASGTGSSRLREFRRRMHDLSREFVDPTVKSDASLATSAGTVLAGIPCSPGIVTGPIVFVRARQDFSKATPGSIIVTDNLRPFWTPVLAGSAGLLCSTGNVLSHGASVAREHGVPAVLGLGEALFSLREGELVTVNGLTGQVFRDPV